MCVCSCRKTIIAKRRGPASPSPSGGKSESAVEMVDIEKLEVKVLNNGPVAAEVDFSVDNQ